jgi:hypothetical protein
VKASFDFDRRLSAIEHTFGRRNITRTRGLVWRRSNLRIVKKRKPGPSSESNYFPSGYNRWERISLIGAYESFVEEFFANLISAYKLGRFAKIARHAEGESDQEVFFVKQAARSDFPKTISRDAGSSLASRVARPSFSLDAISCGIAFSAMKVIPPSWNLVTR